MIDSVWEVLAVLLAGLGAGTINAVVGSGTLISFPILVAVGLPPVTANVSNSMGLVPGSLAGAWGYRRELRGQAARLRWLAPATFVGGALGAVLLLRLPAAAFEEIVPVLIGLGVVLVLVGPRVQRWVGRRRFEQGDEPGRTAWWVWPGVFATGVYGGYFGAAQGVLLMAVFGIGIDDDVQRHNALKNVLAAIANGVAAVVFIAIARVDWIAAGVLGVGAVSGGLLGAAVGRRLPPAVLRAVIVVVGVVAIVAFVR